MLGSRRCETSAWWVPVDLAKSTAPARVGEAQVRRRIGGGREGRLKQVEEEVRTPFVSLFTALTRFSGL